jgi:uncharacterized protein (TIGR00251 family)
MIDLRPHASGVLLPVQAHAGARKNGVLGVRNGMLRVAVTAAREKGSANQAIVAVLSEALGVAKSSIELVSGATSAKKQFFVAGRTAAEMRRVIASIVGDSAR